MRFATDKVPPFVLNKGGFEINGKYYPDFERDDLKHYLKECDDNSIPEALAKELIVAIYNTLNWQNEPNAPLLTEDRYTNFDIDDEIDSVINYIFTKHKVDHIRWNDNEILKLDTFGDILSYLKISIKTYN